MSGVIQSLDLTGLARAYRDGVLTPSGLIDDVLGRIAGRGEDSVWISRMPEGAVAGRAAALTALSAAGRQRLPLYGIPFAVKDNIDVAGLPTTAACPAFAYEPTEDAEVVAKLKAAGAIVVGKTNLDQFATGLNGTRSPHGAPRSVFDPAYISGGSSSGSAVAVASGLVAFSLGTDTAGSGRVPAAFNNLVGVKPTRGLVSSTGLVPACRSLDCITVFAATAGDVAAVLAVMRGHDPRDPYSRVPERRPLPLTGFRFGILTGAEREFFGDRETAALYDAAVTRLSALGGTPVGIDYAPFRESADLLYGGPWIAERLAADAEFPAGHAADMDPTVEKIIAGATNHSAVDAFRGQYRLEALRQQTLAEWAKVDLLLLPTAATTYTVEAMRADPIALNSTLGRYTNFVNLLDCAAIAVPAGFRPDGIPAGVTLIGPAFSDEALAVLGDRLHRALGAGPGVDRHGALPGAPLAPSAEGLIPIGVVGAHLSGMPLNHQLTAPGGVLLKATRTAPDYRMFVLPDTVPAKPGVIRDPGFAGPGLEIEVWGLPPAAAGAFVAAIPAPLGIGKVRLADGSEVSAFLCESHAVAGAEEITALGSWRAHMARK